MSASVQGIINIGASGMVIDVECGLANSLPGIIIVGYAGTAVIEAKERIRGAFTTSRIMLPRKRITVNLAPADIPKADSGFDMPIAVAILHADGQAAHQPRADEAFIGEFGLNGNTRAVRGIIGKILAGREHGIRNFYVPAANLDQARLIPGITLYPVDSFRQLYEHLSEVSAIPAVSSANHGVSRPQLRTPHAQDAFDGISGQIQAKRALTIAAAGGHNVYLHGPPGTGKSMLAKALANLLPPLSEEEMLEVTHLHSLISSSYEQLLTERPFRAPHHTASHTAITGGGNNLRPGELSLAHRGVLFLDELPEFSRTTLESLRQPLEDRVIAIARARNSVQYPANFILVATANPCPCGYYGNQQQNCHCQSHEIRKYQQKISGPILDRIDLHCSVHEVDHARLLSAGHTTETSLQTAVEDARKIQAARYKSSHKLNSDMTNDDIRHYALFSPKARIMLEAAARRLHLSARGYMRTIKVARTIADLAGSQQIKDIHVSDSLRYRSLPTGEYLHNV